ncbi:hypothetical protein B0H15DRAFT_927198 [Mycena belliarum]|uniref:Uncharacterized protein n=1 Tax=Mycena belliarum TaxID=1033014 RepID=A0AAD6UK21_9AGAR|nr:hypothetical protein B0H15DRAFT_927198 [Mycena belliae]
MSENPLTGPGSRGGRGSRGGGRGRGGRGGGRGGRGGRKAAATGSKRLSSLSSLSDSEYEEVAAPRKKARTTPEQASVPAAAAPGPQVTMASTRQRREGAGSNMAVLVAAEKPRPKRTHEQVAAAEAKRAAEADALAREREAAISQIALLDAKLDAARAAEEAAAINDLGDLEDDALDDTSDQHRPEAESEEELEITDEHFSRIEDDDAYVSESEWEPKTKRKAVVVSKRVFKPKKQATRNAIEALAKTLVVEPESTSTTKVVVKKMVQNRDAAAASTKAGLNKAWSSKTPGGSSIIGGLTDEQATAVRPDFDPSATVRVPRKNAMVSVISVSDDEDTPSKAPGGRVRASNIRTFVKMEVDPPKIASLGVRSRKSKPTLKTQSFSSSYTPFTPPSSADVKGLPAFIAPTWKVFLQRCYLSLYMSQDPMALGAVGDDLLDPGRATVDVLQTILDEMHPDVKWELKWDDAICSRAASRMREERGKFAKRGTRYADKEFNSPKYYTAKKGDVGPLRKSVLVASDAKYAVRRNGPAFYRDPTPQAVGHFHPDHTLYIKPRGYLESDAIISVLLPAIRDREWTVRIFKDDHGHDQVDLDSVPVGALGLSAAGIERGYKLHTSGIRTRPLEFSAANFGPAVTAWIEGIKNLRASHWQAIITACGGPLPELALEEEEEESCEEESLDGRREQMHIPSSSPCRE